MKPAYAILRFAKLRTLQNVASSGRHSFRERETPNADSSRTKRNSTEGAACAADLVQAVRDRAAKATETSTADPVKAIEVLATASPEWWQQATKKQRDEFFTRAKEWIREKFGMGNVVSMTTHEDETSPHLTGYIVPLIEVAAKTRKRSVIVGTNPDGTKRRETREYHQEASRRMSASHWLDGREKLSNLQTEFAAKMEPLGLRRGVERSRAKHQSIKAYYARVNAPMASLPKVKTPAPKRMPPEPPKPGIFSSKAAREARAAWEAESELRARQRRQRAAELTARAEAALRLVEDLEPKARELGRAIFEKELLVARTDDLSASNRALERRVLAAEGVAQLFTPDQVNQQRQKLLQARKAAEALEHIKREVARTDEVQELQNPERRSEPDDTPTYEPR